MCSVLLSRPFRCYFYHLLRNGILQVSAIYNLSSNCVIIYCERHQRFKAIGCPFSGVFNCVLLHPHISQYLFCPISCDEHSAYRRTNGWQCGYSYVAWGHQDVSPTNHCTNTKHQLLMRSNGCPAPTPLLRFPHLILSFALPKLSATSLSGSPSNSASKACFRSNVTF